jgi:rRNA maturation protein Nop10
LNKKPRFFCDNCGSEVGQNAKACQNCGRYFASVRCPVCGHTGDETSFKNGCPSCGYSAAPSAGKQPAKKPAARPLVPAGKLPLWVYIVSICAFIGVCAVLIYRLM